MQIPTGNLTLALAQWHKASDAYAAQLLELEHGAPGAIEGLNRISGRLGECKAAVDALTAR